MDPDPWISAAEVGTIRELKEERRRNGARGRGECSQATDRKTVLGQIMTFRSSNGARRSLTRNTIPPERALGNSDRQKTTNCVV